MDRLTKATPLVSQSSVCQNVHKSYHCCQKNLIMNRRSLLGVTACTAGLAGCTSIFNNKDMSRGSTFLNFWNMDGFTGKVRIEPSCRDETVEIQINNGQPNGSIPYVRETSGEECSFEIFINDEHTEIAHVRRSKYGTIDISEDGEVFIGYVSN